jgi:hypothetical protein
VAIATRSEKRFSFGPGREYFPRIPAQSAWSKAPRCASHRLVYRSECLLRCPGFPSRPHAILGSFFSLSIEAQAYLDQWEEHWADKRIHGRTKRQVAAMFAEEKPFLQALPLEPFRYYQYGERTVHLDGCVEVEAAYYGAPPGWIGRQVHVQWDAMFVRLLDPKTGELLREHLSGKRGGHRIRDADRPRRTPPLSLFLYQ